jgi:hypothetical protein
VEVADRDSSLGGQPSHRTGPGGHRPQIVVEDRRPVVGGEPQRRRGWLDAGHALTPDGRTAREAIERATDTSQAALIAALDDDLDAVISSAATIATAVLDARAAPADARKRAAG